MHAPTWWGPEKTTFRDAATGRTVHRLTARGCNVSPYFNSYAWTPDGDWVFFLSLRDGAEWVVACEVDSGRMAPLAGPLSPLHGRPGAL